MSSQPIRRAFAVVGTVVLLATVTTGCGRRGLPAGAGEADGGAGPESAATRPAADPTTTVTPEPTEVAVSTETPAATGPASAIVEPVASSNPAPTPAPLVAPDLTVIEQLLADLDAALGADATADTEEGSAP